MQIVRTVSFPDERLLTEVGPLPAGLRGIVWDLRDRPRDAEYPDIDAVILPYVDAYRVLHSLGLVPKLKLVQTQTTG